MCEVLRDEFRLKSLGFSNISPQLFVRLQLKTTFVDINQTIRENDQSACGPKILYPIWTTFWLVYHLVWFGLEPYFVLSAEQEPSDYFIYFTNWGYVLLGLSNLTDCIVTWYVYCRRKDILENVKDEIGMPWYIQLVWFLFETSNGIAISVTVGFYSALELSTHPASIEFHAINSVYVILNLLVCAKVINLFHVIYPMIFGIVYIIFTIIYQLGFEENPIYPILDWNETFPTAVTVAVLIFVGIPIVHLVLFGLYKLRIFIARNCCHSAQVENSVEIDSVYGSQKKRDENV
ncbi:unnamed protein product [Mytilus coruscus]|uniref:Uncharacterized protein n=1 Tax=Mytilus coruscus TaxID=42192 RepID=A0A6J8BEX3_MYTCO|nr:unnamed protein product [Mytilus coruscus]